jgi:DNA-directed RNA polymerase specialized sigma24 family protein
MGPVKFGRNGNLHILQQALDALLPLERDVLALRIAGLKAGEIAAAMGIDELTVKRIVVQALRRMRDHLVGGHEDGG